MADRLPKAIEVDATFYRWSNYDTPFWARPNTLSGRWHAPGSEATQYLSSSPDGAWAELIRAENLRTEAEVAMVRMSIWQARVRAQKIADLSGTEAIKRAGLKQAELIADDYAICQQQGERLRAAGFRGVLAPAAALEGEQTLVLFGPRRAIDWNTEPKLASAIPAARLTIGSPPEGLVERVRFRAR